MHLARGARLHVNTSRRRATCESERASRCSSSCQEGGRPPVEVLTSRSHCCPLTAMLPGARGPDAPLRYSTRPAPSRPPSVDCKGAWRAALPASNAACIGCCSPRACVAAAVAVARSRDGISDGGLLQQLAALACQHVLPTPPQPWGKERCSLGAPRAHCHSPSPQNDTNRVHC
jgi:hypothetical protein